jgi:hypothetical protein
MCEICGICIAANARKTGKTTTLLYKIRSDCSAIRHVIYSHIPHKIFVECVLDASEPHEKLVDRVLYASEPHEKLVDRVLVALIFSELFVVSAIYLVQILSN